MVPFTLVSVSGGFVISLSYMRSRVTDTWKYMENLDQLRRGWSGEEFYWRRTDMVHLGAFAGCPFCGFLKHFRVDEFMLLYRDKKCSVALFCVMIVSSMSLASVAAASACAFSAMVANRLSRSLGISAFCACSGCVYKSELSF